MPGSSKDTRPKGKVKTKKAADPQKEQQEEPAKKVVSIREFQTRSDAIRSDATRMSHRIFDLVKGDDRKKKRETGPLITEACEKQAELWDQYSMLEELDIAEDTPGMDIRRKAIQNQARNGIAELANQIQQLAHVQDALGNAKKTPESKRAYFQQKLKEEFPVSGDMNQIVKHVKEIPFVVRQGPKVNVQGLLEKLQDKLDEKSEENEDNKTLGAIAEGFNAVAAAYGIFKKIRSMVKAGEADASNIIGIVQDLMTGTEGVLKALNTSGVLTLTKQLPIIGTVFSVLSSVLSGADNIISLVQARKNVGKIKAVEAGLEERMNRNSAKETARGNSIQLDRRVKGIIHKRTTDRMVDGREKREEQRQRLRREAGAHGQNLYLEKLRLKQERSAELAKPKEQQNRSRIEEMDKQIGKLRIAQDADRLGIATETHVRENLKTKDAVRGIVEVAVDLAATIADLFPGVGNIVAKALQTGKAIFEQTEKFTKWVISLLPSKKAREGRKEERRASLADSVMNRLDMLGAPEFALEKLEGEPSQNLDENVLKTAYKEYSSLSIDLFQNMGVSPKVLKQTPSRELLRKTLAGSFAAGS